MMALGTRCSSNRVQIPKVIIVKIHQESSRFLAAKDRFIEVRMVSLDEVNM